MSVFKRYKRKRLSARDKDWSKGTWYVWKRLNGKIIYQSIPEAKTKEQAELAERKIIEAAFNRRYGVTDSHTTFADFANGAYTRYVAQHNVNITAKTHYIVLLVARLGKLLLTEVSPQDCRDAQFYFRRSMSDSSVNRIMSTASKLFSLACEEGILDRNPMQYVKMLKEPPPRSRLLTAKQKERLWTELEKDVLMFRLVTLAVNLPLRRGQILAITPDAIDLPNGLLIAGQSKGREPRVVPLNSAALHTLQAMIQDRMLPFPLKDFRKRWKPMLIAAGINSKDGKRGENFTFHDLRKEFASELIRNNVNPNIVQKLFAHSDMSITNVYMHSEMDQLKEAVNTLDASTLQAPQEIDGPPN